MRDAPMETSDALDAAIDRVAAGVVAVSTDRATGARVVVRITQASPRRVDRVAWAHPALAVVVLTLAVWVFGGPAWSPIGRGRARDSAAVQRPVLTSKDSVPTQDPRTTLAASGGRQADLPPSAMVSASAGASALVSATRMTAPEPRRRPRTRRESRLPDDGFGLPLLGQAQPIDVTSLSRNPDMGTTWPLPVDALMLAPLAPNEEN